MDNSLHYLVQICGCVSVICSRISHSTTFTALLLSFRGEGIFIDEHIVWTGLIGAGFYILYFMVNLGEKKKKKKRVTDL